MSSTTDYFKNIKVDNMFTKKESGVGGDMDCTSTTWSGSISKIPCKIKQFGSFVFTSYSNSWKLRFITLFLIILVCMNYYLIYTNQISSANLEGGMFINSVYFTTTQLSSVGFGDWTPSTGFAKMTTSLANILVMFIAYSMAEEFGYMTVARLNQSEQIEKNIKKDLEPIKIILTPEVKQDIRNVVENSKTKFHNLVDNDSIDNDYLEKKVINVTNKVDEAVNKFKTIKYRNSINNDRKNTTILPINEESSTIDE